MNNLLTKEEMAERLNWTVKKLERMVREHLDSFPRLEFATGVTLVPDGDVLKKFAPDPEGEKEPEAAPPPDPFEEEAATPAKPKPKAPATKSAAKKTTKK